jgi:hypothetical protein
MPQDYMSVEDMLRKQQMEQIALAKSQPYGEDLGNVEDIDTMLAQRYGEADYAEMLRTGASAQRGASTTHYQAGYDALKGRFGEGEELPTYDHLTHGQKPGPMVFGGGGNPLVGQLLGKGVGKGMEYAIKRAQASKNYAASYWSDPKNFAMGDQFQPFSYDGSTLSGGFMRPPMSGPNMAGASGLTFAPDGGLVTSAGPQSQLSFGVDKFSYDPATNTISGGPTSGGVPGPVAAGAGAASGMLTSYLLSKYLGVNPGMAGVAGSTVGGGVSGGLAASAGSTAAGAGAGAIYGGMGAVGAMVASSFYQSRNKPKDRDIMAGRFYEGYHDKDFRKAAQREGFGSRNDALSAPYMWMTQEGRDYRAAVAAGNAPEVSYRDQQAFTAPEYKPSQWEAWVGGMLDAGYKTSDVFDATAFYMTDEAKKERGQWADQYTKGEDYWKSTKGDIASLQGPRSKYEIAKEMGETGMGEGEGYSSAVEQAYSADQSRYYKELEQAKAGNMFTDEQRAERWQNIQTQYDKTTLPWMSEAFKEHYEKDYGHMKDVKESPLTRYQGKKGIKRFHKDFGKQSWYERHGQMDKYFSLRAKHLGPAYGQYDGDAGWLRRAATGPSAFESASDRNVMGSVGIQSTAHYDARDLYGQAGRETHPERSYRRVVTGNTGGEGGHDIYGWEAYNPNEEME